MLATAKLLNLAVRFAVELALLAAVTTAAWHAPSAPALRHVAALAAALAVSTGWVLVVHNPSLATPVRVSAQAAALTLGIGCLLWLHAPRAAVALTVTALLNAALLAAWNQ
jgi:hypothetical protein